jgi:hypothetical protein
VFGRRRRPQLTYVDLTPEERSARVGVFGAVALSIIGVVLFVIVVWGMWTLLQPQSDAQSLSSDPTPTSAVTLVS